VNAGSGQTEITTAPSPAPAGQAPEEDPALQEILILENTALSLAL